VDSSEKEVAIIQFSSPN